VRRSFLLIIGLASLLTATAASAATDGPLQKFQQLCAANNAVAATVIAQADAAGWKPGSTSLAVGQLTDVSVRMSPDETNTMLIVGHGQIPADKLVIEADVCFVGAKSDDTAAIVAAVGTWVGVPHDARQSHPGFDFYAYADNDSGRQVIIDPGDEEAKRLIRSGKVKIVIVQATANSIYIGYLKLKM
jgi:hypothetical protein